MKMLRLIFLCSLILFFPLQARRVFPGEMLWNMSQLTTEASYDIAISQDNMPLTITNSGTYTVAESLTGNIAIEADDVVVDLNGHTLTGNISSDGFVNVIIRNGKITQSIADECMNMDNMVNLWIEDIDFSDGTIGLSALSTGTNILVNNCTFTSQTIQGILMDNMSTVQITECLFSRIPSNSGNGIIHLQNCQNIYGQNIDISNNALALGGRGIVLLNVLTAEFINIKINNNIGTGIWLGIASDDSSDIIINNSEIINNTNMVIGIDFDQGFKNIITNTIISDNAAAIFTGIEIADSETCVIQNCKILSNAGTLPNSEVIGILIDTSTKSKILNNIIDDNTGFVLSGGGIIENDGANNVFLYNSSQNNSGNGILTDASTNGSYYLGNIASGNSAANYSGVPVGTVNIVTYDISAGTYNVTPVATSNIDAIP